MIHEPSSEAPKGDMKDRRLKAEIVDGLLMISVGVDVLCDSINATLSEKYGEVKITNKALFANQMLPRLEDEQEDGTTLIHEMLDRAASEAVEQGAEGFEFVEEAA